MAGAFESVTRVAIQEIIRKHSQESKFGMVLSQEGFESACDDLFELLQTSRSLKAAGDRFMAQQFDSSAPKRPKVRDF